MPPRRPFIRAVLLALLAICALAAPAHAATGAISGTAFQDADRDGVRDAGELPMAGQRVLLLDAAGERQLAFTATDAAGAYRFAGLADGDYRVEVDPWDWWALREGWVPTTTGSVWPRVAVRVAGESVADLGWRRIVTSTDPAAPLSTFTGPSGVRVRSYTDAVAAREIHDVLASGGLLGAEAPAVTVSFALGTSPVCLTSIGAAGFGAEVRLPWIAWLDHGEPTLFHEYGHAWSLFHAHVTQHDTSFAPYLAARDIAGDPRLDTSHAWDVRELIAEDYRQLFGSTGGRAEAQENRDLPAAAAVPGLRDFLATTWTTAPAPAPTPTPTPTPAPPPLPVPALAVDGLAMAPAPVTTSGTAAFVLTQPATVAVEIRTAKGALVRTLLQSAPRAAGAVSATWNRTNAKGQKVRGGTYAVAVTAVAADGARVTRSATFAVT